jgi:AAA+ superfamily predicted ATPase
LKNHKIEHLEKKMNFDDGVIDFILSTYGDRIKREIGTNITFFLFSGSEKNVDSLKSYPGLLHSKERKEFTITMLNDYSLLSDDCKIPIYDFNICTVEGKTFIKIVTPFLFQRAYDFIISKTEEAEDIFKMLKKRREDEEVIALETSKIVGIDLPTIKKEIIDFLLDEKFREFCRKKEIKLKRGVVFTGKPGTGKTTTIKWLKRIAKENDIFVKRFLDPDDFFDNVNEFYSNKKSIFIFEDFDGFLQEREENGEKKKQNPNMFLSRVLNVLDGVEEIENVVSIFTTNMPEILDRALIRPGRIDKLINFSTPTMEQVHEFMELYIPEFKKFFEIIIKELSSKSQDISYAITKGICDDLNILAFSDYKIDEETVIKVVKEKMVSSNKGEVASDSAKYIL